MNSFWNSRKIKCTHKDHMCEFCGLVIKKGSSCNQESGKMEGYFNNYYMCDMCINFISDYKIDLGDGFNRGDFFDYTDELGIKCPNCNEDNKSVEDLHRQILRCDYVCDSCGCEWSVNFLDYLIKGGKMYGYR